MSGLDDCHLHANCTNTNGSFSCDCDPGYTGNGTSCEGKEKRCYWNRMNVSIFHKKTYCVNEVNIERRFVSMWPDIDECSVGTHGCHHGATCMNTMGSFTCACAIGYVSNGISCIG